MRGAGGPAVGAPVREDGEEVAVSRHVGGRIAASPVRDCRGGRVPDRGREVAARESLRRNTGYSVAREPCTSSDTPNIAGSVFLADAIESALVGASTEPIPLDDDAAESLFYQLNVTLKNPEPVDAVYAFYLEIRRYLGRLYSSSSVAPNACRVVPGGDRGRGAIH